MSFELDDPNGKLSVPALYQAKGLQVTQMPGDGIECLTFMEEFGRGSSLPLYRTWTTQIPHLAPGQTRTVDFPQHLLNRLFLRGLQYFAGRAEGGGIEYITLTVKVTCYTVDGEPHKTQFRFRALPFCYSENAPIVVYGHFDELPMYPRDAATPVT